jgi:hypothetical protein
MCTNTIMEDHMSGSWHSVLTRMMIVTTDGTVRLTQSMVIPFRKYFHGVTKVTVAKHPTKSFGEGIGDRDGTGASKKVGEAESF